MTKGQFGLVIGGGLAVVWAAFGFWVFIGVAIASAIGSFVARLVSGELDASALADAIRGRKSSS